MTALANTTPHQPPTRPRALQHAFLLDACWPEHRAYVLQHAGAADILALPTQSLAGDKGFSTRGVGTVHASSLLGYLRSRELLDGPALPAARQRTRFKYDDLLARSYAFLLGPRVDRVTVAQNLLPYLWMTGALARRRFDVLMVRLPLDVLKERVTQALLQHPLSFTLGGFCPNPAVEAAEREALQAAQNLITPHSQVAGLFGPRAVRLPWHLPARSPWVRGSRILLAGPNDALHGVYALRTVARTHSLGVCTVLPPQEYISFWRNVNAVSRRAGATHWLFDVAAAVLPAYSCGAPRVLLQALAAGVPVVASPACGLHGMERVKEVEPEDVVGLANAVRAVLPLREEQPHGQGQPAHEI